MIPSCDRSYEFLYPRAADVLRDALREKSFVDPGQNFPLDTYRVIQKHNAAASSPDDFVREFLLSCANTTVKNRRVPRPVIFPTGGKLIKTVCRELTRFGEPLRKIPAQFKDDVRRFTDYLSDTAKIFFKITNKYVFKGGEEKIDVRRVPYIHRWTDVYRKSILAKLYQLEKALSPEDLEKVTMISLTVSQRGRDQEECLYDLMDNYKKLQDVLRHRFGTTDYFYILEPHATGYAHMHLIYMKLLSGLDKRWIISTWENRYGAGSHKGINFSEPRASDDGSFEAGKISKLRSYVMKYLSKGLKVEMMSNKELLFNALLKKTGIRLWNCSRRFSRIMKAPVEPASDCVEYFECLKVELHDGAYDNEEDSFITQIYPRPKKIEASKFKDEYLFSIAAECIDMPVLNRLRTLVSLGERVLKLVGGFYEVYARRFV